MTEGTDELKETMTYSVRNQAYIALIKMHESQTNINNYRRYK